MVTVAALGGILLQYIIPDFSQGYLFRVVYGRHPPTLLRYMFGTARVTSRIFPECYKVEKCGFQIFFVGAVNNSSK